jgi:hypothetical protein
MKKLFSTLIILLISLSFVFIDIPISSSYAQDTFLTQYLKKKRIGAICRDGTRSNATGRGACSHHGGVDHWLYSKK